VSLNIDPHSDTLVRKNIVDPCVQSVVCERVRFATLRFADRRAIARMRWVVGCRNSPNGESDWQCGARQNNQSVQAGSWMDMWSARPANATLPVRSFRGLMQAAVQRIAGVGRPCDTARCARLRGWLLWRARTIGVSTGQKSFSQQARVHQGRHRKGTFCVSINAYPLSRIHYCESCPCRSTRALRR
jgi:hypothetical protein